MFARAFKKGFSDGLFSPCALILGVRKRERQQVKFDDYRAPELPDVGAAAAWAEAGALFSEIMASDGERYDAGRRQGRHRKAA